MEPMNPTNDAGQGGGGSVPVNPDGQAAAGQAPLQPAQFPEIPGTQPPQAPQPSAPAPAPMTLPLPPNPNPNPVADIPQTVPKTDVQLTTQMATPQVIDDGDLIEKEWVHKAKQIVDRNRNNPHKQSEELTVFRADYMKKRYNKNIKVDK